MVNTLVTVSREGELSSGEKEGRTLGTIVKGDIGGEGLFRRQYR